MVPSPRCSVSMSKHLAIWICKSVVSVSISATTNEQSELFRVVTVSFVILAKFTQCDGDGRGHNLLGDALEAGQSVLQVTAGLPIFIRQPRDIWLTSGFLHERERWNAS